MYAGQAVDDSISEPVAAGAAAAVEGPRDVDQGGVRRVGKGGWQPPDWAAFPTGAARSLRLRVSEAGSVIDSIQLGTRAATVLGRNSAQADLLIAHPSLSRRHAAIVHDSEGRSFVIDLGSSNGTRLNGVALKRDVRHELHHGDVLEFAELRRRFEVLLPLSAIKRASDAGDREPDDRGSAEAAAGDSPTGREVGRKAASDGVGDMAPPPKRTRIADESGAATALPTSFGPRRAAAGVEEPEGSPGAGGASMDALRRDGGGGRVSAQEQRRGELEAAIASFKKPMAFKPQVPAGDDDSDDDAAAAGGADSEGGGPGVAAGGAGGEAASSAGNGGAARSIGLPVSHEIVLNGHSKTILTVALDPVGKRLATGGRDHVVRLWDFGGMDSSHRSFRQFTPEEGYEVRGISYSPTGDRMIVATAGMFARVFSRDGEKVATMVRGNVYLADAANTTGHIAPLMAAHWHPRKAERVLTCARDATVRTWDLSGTRTNAWGEIESLQVIKVKNARGTKTVPTACGWSPDGKVIAALAEDGSLQLWPSKSKRFTKPDTVVRTAHAPGESSCLAYSSDGTRLLTRGGDDTMKLWDVRRLKSPVAVLDGLENLVPTTSCTFSPDNRLLLTCTSVRPGTGDGTVEVFDRAAVESGERGATCSLKVASKCSAVALAWHDKINQLVVGCGNGAVRVMFDPSLSNKGALLSVGRAPKRRDASDLIQAVAVHTPNALPMYKTDALRQGRANIRKDPIATKRPALPSKSDGAGLKTGMKTSTKLIMQHMQRNTLREQDPREQLLKYAQRAADKPVFTGAAYGRTQPEAVLSTRTLEEDMEKKSDEEGSD